MDTCPSLHYDAAAVVDDDDHHPKTMMIAGAVVEVAAVGMDVGDDQEGLEWSLCLYPQFIYRYFLDLILVIIIEQLLVYKYYYDPQFIY